eukprot:3814587-Rhodomonas_salina.1
MPADEVLKVSITSPPTPAPPLLFPARHRLKLPWNKYSLWHCPPRMYFFHASEECPDCNSYRSLGTLPPRAV